MPAPLVQGRSAGRAGAGLYPVAAPAADPNCSRRPSSSMSLRAVLSDGGKGGASHS